MEHEIKIWIKYRGKSDWEYLVKFGKKLERYLTGRGYNGFIHYSISKNGKEAALFLSEGLPGIRLITRDPHNYLPNFEEFVGELNENFPDFEFIFEDFC